MTDSKLVERLRSYGSPNWIGLANFIKSAEEAAAALEAAEEALHGVIKVLAEPANLTPEIALDKEALPKFLDECERATQEAVARARSAYALIRGEQKNEI